MLVGEAAKIIGCSVSTVRGMCASGKMKAKRKPNPIQGGYYYEISKAEVTRIKKEPQGGRGYPRGQKRK